MDCWSISFNMGRESQIKPLLVENKLGKKILHIITRLDMGGSAQNTLWTCLKFGRKYAMVLA